MSIILSKSIFIHIPKTGGTWITEALKRGVKSFVHGYEPVYGDELNCFSQHTLPKRIPEEVRKGKKLFTFVRDPRTWYQSVFAYRSRNDWGNKEKSVISRLCHDTDFNSFVLKCLGVFDKGYYSEMYGKFIDSVDIIGRYENLVDELIRILKEVGEDFDENIIRSIAPINISSQLPQFNGKLEWSDEIYNLMRKKEKYIIERLGY